jgi:hypothetical protein
MDHFRTHPLYNRLSGYTRKEIQVHVDALLEQKLLEKNVHGRVVLGAK